MAVYTVALPKGGSTKSTTATEIAVYLARQGSRVLAVDLDQQGNLSTRLGITPDTPLAGTTAGVLDSSVSLTDAAEPAPSVAGVDVLVGGDDLAATEEQPPADLVTSLRDMLPGAADRWDDVVIDTPPDVHQITLTGLAAADHVVVSMTGTTEAYDQIDRLEAVIAGRLRPRVRPGLRIDSIIPTSIDLRRRIDREVLAQVRERFGDLVTPHVRQAVAVRDAYTAGLPVSLYDPDSEVAADYTAAIDHLMATTKGDVR